jgi:hypothetical protein
MESWSKVREMVGVSARENLCVGSISSRLLMRLLWLAMLVL